ncbi:stage IV sporulation protein A [Abyssisolibacter fermentans]|uniref:stage IV sporulation protein A n=1 Tax=Abyssisolibacter fermentans TaxID=1766203 RepID=UPI00082988FE|nr:stage IV sporulation protein A [Abyssisolibacter fermentans]
MDRFDIYKDIADRTQGDIYMGVVGPVRTGKSTFIKRFMDLLVLPNIKNTHRKTRAIDSIPQSGAGKTIMTTEPKFVPSEAVELTIKENLKFKIRMVDCVGYLVNGALGHIEGQMPRMVTTPWYEKEIPFEEAAEIGTKKVITDHSTIGLVVTTDGSITDIERHNYIQSEERVINELKALEKPFVVLLNSKHPMLDSTLALRESLEQKYNVPVINIDCLNMSLSDINDIFEKLLYEFPIKQININLPGWVDGLSNNHWIKQSIINTLRESIGSLHRLSEIAKLKNELTNLDVSEDTIIEEVNLGYGNVDIRIKVDNQLFYKAIEEYSGIRIDGEHQLLSLISKLSKTKKEFDRIEKALNDVKEFGYGLVPPAFDELELLEPEIFKEGKRYGVKLKANAPSLHLIRADIATEVSPIIGTERQSEDLVKSLLEEFENNPNKIWESNMLGKSLHDLVQEQLQIKVNTLPLETRSKLQRALQRVINDGGGGLICVII